MGKLLRILVILFLLVSIAALVLAHMLFAKRELLKGRTQKLENAVITLATAIEAEPGTPEQEPDLPPRDISPCTTEILDNPEVSSFWDDYSAALEVLDQPTLDLNKRKSQLAKYYQTDPATGDAIIDPNGYPVTKGPGTMQEVLEDTIAKAADQYNRLNQTRQQLKALRVELVDTINELNKNKRDHRAALKQIKELQDLINPLKAEISQLKDDLKTKEQEKQELQDQVAEQERRIAIVEEQRTEKAAEVERLKEENAKLRETPMAVDQTPSQPGAAAPVHEVPLESGVKGTVAAVDPEWNFVIVELAEKFLQELLGEDLSRQFAPVELMIKRSGDEQAFVTKVRLVQLNTAQRLGVADILAEWQQLPVRQGDVLFK